MFEEIFGTLNAAKHATGLIAAKERKDHMGEREKSETLKAGALRDNAGVEAGGII